MRHLLARVAVVELKIRDRAAPLTRLLIEERTPPRLNPLPLIRLLRRPILVAHQATPVRKQAVFSVRGFNSRRLH
jgi:hypothetical protein